MRIFATNFKLTRWQDGLEDFFEYASDYLWKQEGEELAHEDWEKTNHESKKLPGLKITS